MTTNSFGGALPRFDFPAQPQPAISRIARINKALPVVLFAAAAAALAIKTRQNLDAPITTSMLFARPQNLVPQGQQTSMDKRNGDVGLKPNQ
ncbi:hypothetical protein FLAG1_07511 [Fusarium langsethiae]|uniref:Uncharacterized protein n=1 Tax=Fusarium langsethiae TaxID=179993 RepID=A0A0M9ETR3_FUSLA|nr:hypothetical protein FLAG1_07511 [Fusarium langsethiae]